MSLDLKLNLAIQNYLANPFLNEVFKVITYLGDRGFFWILLIVLLLIPKKTRYVGFVMLVSLILDFLGCNIIKLIVNRLRPYESYEFQILIEAPSGSSFPSIHSSTAFVCAWVYFLLAKKKPYELLRWPFLILAALIAFSRLYLFVHYPSDVIVGAVIGILVAYIGIYICQYFLKMGKLEFLRIDPYDTVYLKYPFKRKT